MTRMIDMNLTALANSLGDSSLQYGHGKK
jgi:hypothetical protein